MTIQSISVCIYFYLEDEKETISKQFEPMVLKFIKTSIKISAPHLPEYLVILQLQINPCNTNNLSLMIAPSISTQYWRFFILALCKPLAK